MTLLGSNGVVGQQWQGLIHDDGPVEEILP